MNKTLVFALLVFPVFQSCAHQKTTVEEQTNDSATTTVESVENSVTELPQTEKEWKAALSDKEYEILRLKGTEYAFTGNLYKVKDHGRYVCAGCGCDLFSSETKFESGTGWPSFYAPADSGKVAEVSDFSIGMVRVEVTCAKCGGHLGHVFDDGPQPTGKRYCINSASLDFIDEEGNVTEGDQ